MLYERTVAANDNYDLGCQGRLMIEEPEVRQRLRKTVRGVVSDETLCEDMVQEAQIHLWQTEEAHPGQMVCWYLKACRFLVLDLLGKGRSVDAVKRRGLGSRIDEVEEDSDGVMCALVAAENNPFEETSAADLLRELGRELNPRQGIVLGLLAEGYERCEIADQLGVSQKTVIRDQGAIAERVRQMENCLVGANAGRL